MNALLEESDSGHIHFHVPHTVHSRRILRPRKITLLILTVEMFLALKKRSRRGYKVGIGF